ncbi:MAG: exodeoxyribonuclease VII large subunit [Anaerovoracaceae bacterium]
MALKPISVSQLNDYISRVLITDPILGNVTVLGEISNLKYHQTGHIYFSIIDDNSKINCFLPKDYGYNLHYELTDGMEVTIVGSINVFKKNGTYSLYVKNVEVAGEGNLTLAFEQLKKKLLAEGLFEKEHKKPIPKFPKKIGIITSETGAAVKDILKIIEGRNNFVDIIIFPVLVQGQGAAKDISQTIDYVNQNFQDIDTLIVGRGGGSADDLWSFNEEVVARSIYNSRIPIISAVGHEIDFTISDMVADLRAETPTAAAQIAVADMTEILRQIEQYKDDLFMQLNNKLKFYNMMIENDLNQLKQHLQGKIENYTSTLETAKLILEENNPKKVLNMGYSILSDTNNKVISSKNDIKTEEMYNITFKDGTAKCKIITIGSEDYGEE